MRIHAGNPDRSYRLKRVLVALREAGKNGLTSWELITKASVVSPATCVSELRKCNYIIDCKRVKTLIGGSRVYQYTYKGKKKEQ